MTDDHLTPEQSRPLKQSYDRLGEQCLQRLDQISPPHRSALPRNSTLDVAKPAHEKPRDEATGPSDEKTPPPRDLYALLRDNADKDEKLAELWQQINTVPSWVDWKQIERGQDVFYRYGSANLTGLAYQSLLGGMGAARVVETLARTGGFTTKVARRRLFETTQHILQCTKSLESMQPGGDGFASTVRVRLLHAAVRQRILKLARDRPSYYNVEEWGVPINDLDSMATIGTFSATLIWLSLPRQGIWLREQEIVDYVALWRYVAHVIGCPTDYFDTPVKAKAVMESLLMYEISPTPTSRILANNIIKSLDDQPPGYASADMLIASARWLNGNELCDELGLARPSLYYWSLIAGQCFFFMGIYYAYRLLPESWDRKKISTLKRVFYAIVVDSKYGLGGNETYFEFQYVPEFSTITEMDDGKDGRVKNRGLERRNLRSLCIALGLFGATAWCGFKTVSGVIRLVSWTCTGFLSLLASQ